MVRDERFELPLFSAPNGVPYQTRRITDNWCWTQDLNLRGVSPAAYKAAAVDRLANPALILLILVLRRGYDPLSLGYQPSALPLSYRSIVLVDLRGIEPRISACKADVFPLALEAHCLVLPRGIEPLSRDLQSPAMTTSATAAL